jgi:TetR/AcrR family transcriptional regulator
MIRHLFGDKDALWDAAAAHLFARLQIGMAAALDGTKRDDPASRLGAQVRATVRAAAQTPALAGFVMQAGLAGGARYEMLIERHLRPLYAVALAPYRALAATGQARALPAHFVFLAATNAAINPFAQAANSRALAGIDISDPAVAEAYADALVAILTHGLLGGGDAPCP